MKYFLSFLLTLMTFGLLNAQSYNNRFIYEDIHSLLGQGKWHEAKALVDKNLANSPDDLAFILGAAAVAEMEMKSVPLFRWSQIENAHQTADENYKKLLTIKGSQVNEYKPYFSKMIGDKNASAKDVIAYVQQKESILQTYFEELKAHKKEALVAERAYKEALSVFRELMKTYNYSDKIPVYITGEDLKKAEMVGEKFHKAKESIEQLEAAIATDDAPLTEANKTTFKWSKPFVSGTNVSPLHEGDFLRKEVKVSDLGAWVALIKEKGGAINDLRQTLYQHIETLENTSNQPISLKEYQEIATAIEQWHQEMSAYDDQSSLNYLTRYYLDKGKFHALETEYAAKRKRSFLHKKLREELIQEIKQQADSAFNSLRYVSNPAVYMPNQQAVMDKMGGVEALKALVDTQDSVWHAEKSHWSGIAFSAYSLDSRIPDEISAEGKVLVMRPAKGEVSSAQAAGKYTLDNADALSDGSVIAYGSKPEGAMIARLGKDGSVKWSKTYAGASVVYTTDYHEGQAGYILKESDNSMKFMLTADDGTILVENQISFIPTARYKTSAGLFLLSDKNDKLQVFSCHEDSKTVKASESVCKGNIEKSYVKGGFLYLGIHYQSMNDLAGKALADSQTNNVAIGVFSIDGSIAKVEAVSLGKPAVIVQIFENQGKISIKGLKGKYRKNQYGSYTEGEPWEKTID